MQFPFFLFLFPVFISFSKNRINKMFKKFDKDSVSATQALKSSAQKAIRTKADGLSPLMKEHASALLPKKEVLKLVKCKDYVELIANTAGDILFFRDRDGPPIPTLRQLHKYPFLLKPQQVDKGAIKFILSGANIMCPGLTSPGANMLESDADEIVAIYAEGKSHALAIGKMKLSSKDVAKVNKGVGIETLHYLNDGLWNLPPIKV
jgi:PUA domain protein